MGKLHGGQVVHDSDVDEALGILHHAEDGLKVWSPAGCTEGRRGTLPEKNDRDIINILNNMGKRFFLLIYYICTVCISPTGRRWTACC